VAPAASVNVNDCSATLYWPASPGGLREPRGEGDALWWPADGTLVGEC